ncbi:Transcription factor-like protein [Hapsidospora chrysogenum ATCC 11550]|uniref:Transcription factor-like protein n=1 Tax=Hapsidospora chrysogenum (strain ATCC 11550 / CBS 779.69 / DSM 880 / IAM 14645 / JCM 23072 / IMI 49137) TaxID=857340 RepID=A0A086T3H8_HAPC1|nr:Transcription factor-like protein [Hapsidospora chrysogenum ATCC 11550]
MDDPSEQADKGHYLYPFDESFSSLDKYGEIHDPGFPQSIAPLALLDHSRQTTAEATTQSDASVDVTKGKNPDRKAPLRSSSRRTRAKSSSKSFGSESPVTFAGKSEGQAEEGSAIQEGDDDDDDGKAHLRARNRKAAAKFRVRKKQSIKQLQGKEETVREIHRALSEEASQLRDEELHLKNMVLEHSSCGCPQIDDYIQQAAASLAQEKSGPAYSIAHEPGCSAAGVMWPGVDDDALAG